MPNRKSEDAIDWAAIERQYRLGQKSNLQLGREYGVDPSGIGKRARKYGWIQDKSEDVAATANTLLIQAASGRSDPNSTPSALEIKAAGQAQADVVLSHRRGLARLRSTQAKLLDQIEQTVDNMVQIHEIIELLRSPSEQGVDRLNDAMRRAMSRPELVDDLKKLAEVDERIRKGEREAFGINDDAKPAAFEELLTRLGEQGS